MASDTSLQLVAPEQQSPPVEAYRHKVVDSWMWLRILRWRLIALVAAVCRYFSGQRHEKSFGILMYHRVAEVPRHGTPPTWNIEPNIFRRQLEGLLAKGYQAWPLKKVLEYRQTGRLVPQQVFVVTFDDGYENFYANAFPILKALDVPATLFLATNYLDGDKPFPFDDWQHAGADNVPEMSWKPIRTSQCRDMHDSGLIELACHSHRHQVFAGRPESFREDLLESREVLKREFGIDSPTFSYPFGIVDPELQQVSRELGFECSLGTNCETINLQSDPLTWGRMEVKGWESANRLSIRLDGWYDKVENKWLEIKQIAAHPWKFAKRLLLSASFLSLFDQAVVSGTGFVTNIIVAKGSPEDLAKYYFTFRIYWVFRTLQHQLITIPYKVIAQRLKETALATYTGSSLVHQIGLALISCVVLLGMLACSNYGVGPEGIAPTLSVLLLVLPAVLMREFVRQLTFSQFRPDRAFLVDSSVAVVQLGGLLLFRHFSLISVPMVYAVMGTACAIACLEWFLCGRPEIQITKTRVIADGKNNWGFGKWGLATDTLANVMFILLAWWVWNTHDEAEAGRLAAGMIPVGIASMFVMGVANVFLPEASRKYSEKGVNGLTRVLLQLFFSFLIVIGSICLGTWMYGEEILQCFFGERYAGCSLIATFCIGTALVGSLGYVPSIGMATAERPQANFWAEVLNFCIAMISAYFLIPKYGAAGAALAALICVFFGSTVRLAVFLKWRQQQLELERNKVA